MSNYNKQEDRENRISELKRLQLIDEVSELKRLQLIDEVYEINDLVSELDEKLRELSNAIDDWMYEIRNETE